MSGWKAAGWGGVCSMGALFFLRIVAQEVERTNRGLSMKDTQAKKDYERILRECGDDEPLVVHTTSPTERGFVVRN